MDSKKKQRWTPKKNKDRLKKKTKMDSKKKQRWIPKKNKDELKKKTKMV